MSIWETLGTFGFFGFIFVVLVFCAPALLIWQAYTILKTMTSKIEKHGSYLVVGLIVFFIIGLYVETVGKPETSTQFYEFGSYFGGIGAGIGVLIAGLGYLQSARSEKRAFEKELIADELKSKKSLVNQHERNIELTAEIMAIQINKIKTDMESVKKHISFIKEEIKGFSIKIESTSKEIEESKSESKEKLKQSIKHFEQERKARHADVEIAENLLPLFVKEIESSIETFNTKADITKQSIDNIQLDKSTHLTELQFNEKKLEASYKIEKIQLQLQNIDLT